MTGFERQVRVEVENGNATPVVARIKGEEEFILSYDAGLKDYILKNIESVNIEVPGDVVGSRSDVVQSVMSGALLMYVEYDKDGGKYTDVIMRAFEDQDEGRWWRMVMDNERIRVLYNDHRDEFELVREFYDIGIMSHSMDRDVRYDAQLRLREFRDRYDEAHPEDDETVGRLTPIIKEITHTVFRN